MATSDAASPPEDQSAVLRFLASGAAFGCRADEVVHRQTHGAHVFLGPREALKVKRAVRFPYMDLSTRDRRRAMIEREFALNRRIAPQLYLAVAPITRAEDGTLSLEGAGEPVEWALRMRRFDERDLLSRVAARGELDDGLAKELADAVAAAHAAAPPRLVADGDRRQTRVLDDVAAELHRLALFEPAALARLAAAARTASARAGPVLRTRGAAGHVRHCHGDLHLNNIVLWRGAPLPFDALEFDAELATTDTLYDLAFLLMDLDHAGLRRAADIVLNRYLWRTGDDADLDGLTALPLLLGTRSAVRAMVTGEAAAAAADPEQASRQRRAAAAYLDDALRYLTPPPPRLVAVAGLSGTGKSTLAASLAPALGPAPGAVHLRSDLERKALFGVGELDRLPPEHYTPETAAAVYERLLAKARRVLAAGHAVVVDAVMLRTDERQRLAALAAETGVQFQGLWLAAAPDRLRERVGARSGDASDATPAVVDKQLAAGPGALSWPTIDAGGSAEATAEAARRLLGIV